MGCERVREIVPAGATAGPPPIVLVSIDTLRSDHLPAYGYRGVATPAIDALRRDGVLFERAYAHTPLTLPSHASLFTGLLPGVHGVRDNVGYALDGQRIAAGELPFLPQLLRRRGYATAAAVSAFVLQGKTGMASGFELYEDTIEMRSGAGLGGLQRPGDETLRAVVPWLRQQSAAAKPFFLFLHLYEPHTPYEPPARFRSVPSPYDGEIAAADAIVGELLDELHRAGAYERAAVVLLSDHGEGLGDHGEEEHGLLLHREAIQVPLLLKLPAGGHAGASVAAPAQLIDVAPTLAELAGIEPPASWRGISLLSLLAGERSADAAPARRIFAETFYPRLHFGWSELTSLTDGRWHLVEGPAPELYDLAGDPGERRNVLQTERRQYAELRRELRGLARALTAPAAVDEETRRAMAALGYLGSANVATSGPLPDPKSQLPSLRQLKTGFQQMHERRYAEAERTFRALVGAHPQMIDAWEFLGKALGKLGRPEESLAAYQEALARSGGAPHVARNVASLLFDLGRLDDAAAHAQLAAATMPSFTHGLLARIALRRQDLEAAEREARLALDDASERLLPRLTLAEVLHARRQYEAALATAGEAKALYAERAQPDPELIQGLHLLEGKILADLGRVPAAEAAFGQEIALFPDDPRAYSSLAVLLALTGRGEQAAATLERMTTASPTPVAYAEAVRAYRALGDERGASAVLSFARRKFPGNEVLEKL
jgi:arylsulfatase A-like enzyme/Flp pilus assembly protein TadD